MIAITGVVLALAMLVIVTTLLLTRRLREKYAALWIIIGLGMLILGAFPGLLLGLTSAFGVVLPANLLFAMAILLLLGVALHLSWELSQAEDEIRRAAEELAILRADHDGLAGRIEALESGESKSPGVSSGDD
ncbi:DUF2304 domain-containing protein [Microbacterium sp. NPDC089698]|jgi:hypothetical protein|uniref:DUF2304 domain-containing protein n=1 Tax=unclassified Microbacterium TaxID=2609290 RepID=UPI0028191540|nr:DUF2304 domain-containing protein [Microbacterium sp.]MDR2323368.1 DUF2304 domain-containing protein [Microbacterium sp.]